MVNINFLKPQVDIAPATQVHSAVANFWHAVGGLYIWEYFTTLDYEWRVIRRQLPYRWTIWIYSLSRFTALLSIILFFIALDVTTPINCQLWMLLSTSLLFLSSIAATLLIVIRTIAILNRNKVATVLAITVWGISIGFHIYNLVRLRFKWISSKQACEPARVDITGFIPMIVTDMTLLVIILAGLLVLRCNGGGTFGLSRLLWTQGVIWLALGSAIEIPPLVLSCLHLNDEIHSLFVVPCLIAMIIAATRMHRSLVYFACGSTEVTHENCAQTCLVFSKAKRRTDTVPTTRDGISGSVSEVFDQRSTGSKNDGDTSTVFSIDEQIPHISGDPSKLDLTQESAHPPPTAPSPVFEAESV